MPGWGNPIVYGFLIVLGGVLLLVLWSALGLPKPW
jgi:hypothetical protein